MSSCRLCQKKQFLTLLDLGAHPIAHHFLNSPSEEEYRHPVTLCFCEHCGLIQLSNPIPGELLYTNYICFSSWKYQPHIPHLVQMIEDFTDLDKSSMVLEVGSNDGIFLDALHHKGFEKLVGIEPAHDVCHFAQQKGLNVICSYFTPQTAEDFVATYGKCDLFISRQMLEHISDLEGFQKAMQIVLSPGGFVVFEVPNFACNLDAPDYTIWEEHVNYFIPETLALFLSQAGIQIIHKETTVFSGGALIVIGQYLGYPRLSPFFEHMKTLREKAIRYRERWPVFRNALIQYLRQHKEKGGKVAAYGAGARFCSLVNFLNLGPYIEFIVDDQPEKQGKYMPGSKLPILPGNALEEHSIDLCLLAVNAESEDKVIAKHPEFQKRGGEFVSVLPPSDRLPHFWRQI